MTETFSTTPSIRRRMQQQRERDTAPELALRRALHRRGLRFRLDRPIVPGTRRRVDIVFSRARLAIFVDGCFWHGCPYHGSHVPRVNTWYWPAKIAGNKARDVDTNDRLNDAGWQVLRFWEHDDPDVAADHILEVIRT
jgi:DNA mismatch endonuclease, patch repair protein